MEPIKVKTIPITVDKSHLVVIGERLYAQSLELIRELVSNAYDADATHVWIEITPLTLSVKDNGVGMDEADLRQYFTIGSSEKRINKISPIFCRTRIGEFGIGKFAALSACNIFTVYTQKGDFAAKLTFDKNVWMSFDEWTIPIHILPPTPTHGNGTTVTLEYLKKELSLPDIERFLRERIPLKIPNFHVYLDGKRITPTILPGKKFTISKIGSYGKIEGEIIIPSLPQKADEPKGIECFVKGVFVKRETFGFEYSHTFASTKIIGQIHTDFLPITSDRSRFVMDSPEYKEFYRLIRQEIGEILKKIRGLKHDREEYKADEMLRDALSHIRKALKKNPEFAPKTHILIAPKEKEPEKIAPHKLQLIPDESAAEKHFEKRLEESISINALHAGPKKKSDRSSKKVRVKTISGKEIVARRMQIGEFSIVCKSENLTESDPPVIWESGVILINRNHPLYRRFVKNHELLTLYVTELITQEIVKIRTTSPKDAFNLQNQILTDAWI